MANNTGQSFNLRAFASVFAGLSFILMVVTGLVLFSAPSCRIARDTSWAVWGHDKDQWVAVHVWLSIAFVIASFIHIYLNWAVLINYFRSRIHRKPAFRAEWLAALAICVVLYAGSARGVTPFSSLMTWKETFKHGSTEPGQGWRAGRAAGQRIRNGASHAEQDHVSGEPASNEHQEDCEQSQGPGRGPGRFGAGMGRKTLRQFCSDEGIELTWAISHLKSQGLKVRDTMTMREIADALGRHPRELRAVLQPG
ncbi:MAG: DUF4405 domain-containing protein [Phycisphaerales bacterium]|nr:MAG: DUF4405 domain-containing protein [Phycisphaerales bacterium]